MPFLTDTRPYDGDYDVVIRNIEIPVSGVIRGAADDYPIAVSGVVTAGISNTSEIGTSVSTALDIPKNLEGTLEQIQVADYVVQETLMEILKQLKIMNLHLSLMTDTWIRKQDIFDI